MRSFTEDEILLAQEEQDSGNFSKVKAFLITAKTVFLILQSVKAIPAWSGHRRIQTLLVSSAAIVGAAYAYSMTSKELLPLFLLQSVSMWVATLCLPALLEFPPLNDSVIAAKNSAIKFQKILSAGFVIAIFLAVKKNSASCDPDSATVVPWGFFVTFILFFVQWLNVMRLQKNGFNISWSPKDKKAEDLFKAQTDRFVSTYGFLVKWHLVELILGGLLSHKDIVMCVNEGKSWAYSNAVGNIFFVIHTVAINMSAGMIRSVFIKTVKASGYWLSDSDLVDDTEEEDSKKKK